MAEMTMVERVARAISVADLNITAKTYPEMPMERMAEHLRTVVENGHYDAMARAAIEAMREPTEAMIDASWDTTRNVDHERRMLTSLMGSEDAHHVKAKCRWGAMIDAALNEEVAG